MIELTKSHLWNIEVALCVYASDLEKDNKRKYSQGSLTSKIEEIYQLILEIRDLRRIVCPSGTHLTIDHAGDGEKQ